MGIFLLLFTKNHKTSSVNTCRSLTTTRRYNSMTCHRKGPVLYFFLESMKLLIFTTLHDLCQAISGQYTRDRPGLPQRGLAGGQQVLGRLRDHGAGDRAIGGRDALHQPARKGASRAARPAPPDGLPQSESTRNGAWHGVFISNADTNS